MQNQRVATVLSILGVIIASAGVVATYAQYRTANIQTEAALKALQPQIEVTITPGSFSTWGVPLRDRTISITSDGGPIYNFYVNEFTWFDIENIATEKKMRTRLSLYFTSRGYTGKVRGEIATLYSRFYPSTSDVEFEKFERAIGLKVNDKTQVAKPVTVLFLFYSDSMRKEHRESFLIKGNRAERVEVLDIEKQIPPLTGILSPEDLLHPSIFNNIVDKANALAQQPKVKEQSRTN